MELQDPAYFMPDIHDGTEIMRGLLPQWLEIDFHSLFLLWTPSPVPRFSQLRKGSLGEPRNETNEHPSYSLGLQY